MIVAEGRTGEKHQILVRGSRRRTGQCPRRTLVVSMKTFTKAESKQNQTEMCSMVRGEKIKTSIMENSFKKFDCKEENRDRFVAEE